MPTPAFTPCWWLAHRHLQTLWPSLMPRPRAVATTAEHLELPDGDVVELAWAGMDAPSGAPVLVILHGLEGSADSHYARPLLAGAVRRGWRAVLLHFRGTAGRINRLARSYHSGDTADLDHLVAEIARRYPQAPRLAVGISIGGNVLLKWLGETGAANPLTAAAAACVPFDLAACADALSHGFARIYQRHLVASLVRSARAKAHLLDVATGEWRGLDTFRRFDARLTAPLNGFASVAEYYAKASCRPYLMGIAVPTLVVAAADDPFVPAAVLPTALPPTVTLEVHPRGGHVGFVAGPWRPRRWLEERLLDGLAGVPGMAGTLAPP